ncbi:MAG: sugar transferase, partial [Candidatus Zixiibacteriota bacterium]
ALRVENLGPSALLTHGLKNPGKTRTALVYGTGAKGKSVVDLLLTNSHSEISPIGFIDPHASGLWSYRDTPLIGGLKALKDTILNRQVDLLFIAAENKDLQHSQAVFDIAEKMGVPICVMPHIYKSTISECRLKTLNGQPALVYSSASEEGLSTVAKAALDKTAAVIAIVILAPVMALVAAAIKLTSKGPVLFRQTRLGENGAPFTVFKFRSMREDAEAHKGELLDENEMSGPVFKIRDDPRITRVGEFIRKYSIDELPQLFNVLRGDMSLVGPRPPLPAEVSQFTPWQRRKLAVKPGVTCIWQVSGRNGVDFDDWMKLDLEYIDNWSLWLDTKILARTIPTVLKGTGQ